MEELIKLLSSREVTIDIIQAIVRDHNSKVVDESMRALGVWIDPELYEHVVKMTGTEIGDIFIVSQPSRGGPAITASNCPF